MSGAPPPSSSRCCGGMPRLNSSAGVPVSSLASARMEQPIQPLHRFDPFRGVGFALQQRLQVDPGQSGQHMGQADEAAEHAMAIEPVGEISIARPADGVALVPIGARVGIEPEPQIVAVALGIGRRIGFTEELPEIVVFREGAKAGQFELEQRQMGFVEIDREHLRRLGREIGQRVAAAGRDGDDGRTNRQLQRREIGLGIFPDLGIDEAAKPEGKQTVPNSRLLVTSAVADGVRDQLRAHLVSESTIF